MKRSAALITINPTIDIFLEGEDFSFSQKIFAKRSCIAAGGSAVNVARGLKRIGRPFKLYIIVGGGIGTLLRSKLSKEKIPFSFTENKWETRVAEIYMSGDERKMFVTPSPKVEASSLQKFISDYYLEIASHDLVLIGGSIPEQSCNHIISELLRPLINQGSKVIIDSRGLFAQKAYREVPYIIKYNKEKALNYLQGAPKDHLCSQLACSLHRNGTSLVIYNTEKYYYAIYNGHNYRYPNYTQFAKRIYGRGDAFLAGLIAALLYENNFDEAVRFAIACGASFISDFPLGEISPRLISNYIPKIQCDLKWRMV